MTTRRGFLASLLAAGSLPALSWADAGSPAYLAAAKEPDGSYALFGLTAQGQDVFRIPLPGRGHAAAAHPTRPEAVGFARRPGTYAVVIDCVTGQPITRLETPEGRHFMGHGEYLFEGDLLCTPENAFDIGEGRIGLWAARDGYKRIGEIPSGGLGPHDLKRLPGGNQLVVANGGILTKGREMLNIDTMQPSLAYVDIKDGVLETVELAPELHHNSIRHLALGPGGLVAFAMQWHGDLYDPVPLLGLHRRGTAPQVLSAPLDEQMQMKGYAGSVAFTGAGDAVAITSPRGGRMHRFTADGDYAGRWLRADICGLAPAPGGFLASDGQGGLHLLDAGGATPLSVQPRAWDNHAIALG
ncbi:DUF1513 domain-containing protein [Actibacterium sp. D379-3]